MTETRPQKRLPRVPRTLSKWPSLEPKSQTRATRIEAVRAAHYARLALIGSEYDRGLAALTAQAQELRRLEHARYRTELEEAKKQ